MKNLLSRHLLLGVLITVVFCSVAVQAADPVYRDANEYPILDEIKSARNAKAAERDSIRAAAEAEIEAAQKAHDDAKKSLRVDWSKVKSPKSPEDFKTVWHNPPLPQYYTGTCWAFCSTSFIETEVQRTTGQEIKLSEMWTVYWEYVEKSRAYIESFGHTSFGQGSQDHGTLEIMRQYGTVPADAYAGILQSDGRFDHTPMVNELKGFLDWVLESETWDADHNLIYVRAILDKHMGPPPTSVQFDGRTYSPKAFRDDVLKVNVDDYLACVSRMDQPFYAQTLLDVPDNWRRKDTYLNLPLHDFYEVIKDAIKDGYTLSVGVDNSESGMDGNVDTAIIPEWDIPRKYINQGSREMRFANKTTTDDHGIHLVGFTRHGGRDWFLMKDSNRSSRLGEHKGYYFWSGDYVKMKVLSFVIHKDRLEDLN